MTEEFNKWWDNDLLTQNNPYVDGTPAFWAWEGWRAGVKAEREVCAQLCDDLYRAWTLTDQEDLDPPDALDCKRAIRNRGKN